MSWKNPCEVNPGVKVNLWLVNPQVNLSMEQSAINPSLQAHTICHYLTQFSTIMLAPHAGMSTDVNCSNDNYTNYSSETIYCAAVKCRYE